MSTRAWIAFASVSVLWGIPYLFIKVAVDDGMPPAFLAWVRVLLAAVVLLARLILAGSWLSTDGRLPPGVRERRRRARAVESPHFAAPS